MVRSWPDPEPVTPSLIVWENKQVAQASDEEYDSDADGMPLDKVDDQVIPPSTMDAAPPESVWIEENYESWICPPASVAKRKMVKMV